MIRILTSAALFFVGEKLELREDMGGGTWLVVRLLPRDARWFHRCIAKRLSP